MTDLVVKDEWHVLNEQAETLLKSGFLPASIKTKEQAIAIGLKGKELGIPLMQAISSINIIQGKPCASAELMLALVYKNCPRGKFSIKVTTNEKCVIEAARPGEATAVFEYTIEDAKRAGIVREGGPWSKYPAAMLRARNISAVARGIFPDAISGISYTPEELGANVDEEGKVIEMEIIK